MKQHSLFAGGLVWVLLAGGAASAQTLTVTSPVKSAVSGRLDEEDQDSPSNQHNVRNRPRLPGRGEGGNHDDVEQNSPGSLPDAHERTRFPGVGANGSAPPDTNMAVGPNHIVQVVNTEIAVFTKSGALLSGYPKSLGSMWSALGGGCTGNFGDPVAQYDKLADRFIVTQLGSFSAPFLDCIAVSTTNDPTGSYYLYSYSFGNNLNDYPKFGVWPTATNSAYLSTYNLFQNGAAFVGSDLCAYDRTAMLAGAPSPAQICFTISNDGGFLPADLDGSTPPVDGTSGYFLNFETLSSLRLYALTPNFANPNSSTLTLIADLGVAGFSEACGGGTCIPQPGTSQQLDSLGDRLMYRLAFRNFGDHEAMVVNHSVTAGSSVGVRWYELRSPVSTSGSFALYQQGTFAPDATFRWMGSAAMDSAGDIAIGYSASSSSVYPGIRWAGRVPGDALGTLESEVILLNGIGSQTGGLSRWGDYSALRIDPSDDCTFWYTNQYQPSNGSFNWATFFGSFKFVTCGRSLTATTTTVSSSSSTSTYGAQVTFTATVTPSSGTGPTGSVTFKDSSTTLGSSPLNPNGQATYTTSSLTGGSHSITAVYGGDSNYSGSTSSAVTQTVDPTGTSTGLVSSVTPSTYGQSVTFTATVTPSSGTATPTGNITFKDGGTTLATVTLSGGKAALATSILTAGTHSITASYGGDGNYSGSTSGAVSQGVNQVSTTTTVASSANPSTSGQSVTFTATVSASSATGTVTFLDGTNSLGTGNLTAGKATLTTSILGVGSHSITAKYGGDTNFSASTSSTLTQTVNATKITTTTSVASSLNPSPFGQQVTFTATVSPISGPTGTVTFKDGTTTIGSSGLNGSGMATLAISSLAVGSHSITAAYSGDNNYTTSTSSALTQTVNKATTTTTLTSSLNPSNSGQSVTFTATVTPSTAGGTVKFLDGGTSIGTGTLSGGTATFSTSSLAAGTHSITAQYGGDTNDAGSTSNTVTQTVNALNADFSISVSPSSRTISRGSSTNYTVTVSPVNGFTGSVSFSVSGLPFRTNGSFSPNPLAGGSGTSTLTISTGRKAPTGTRTLTITATSGGLVHSVQVTLTLN